MTLTIALAQLNPIVGDLAGNAQKALAARAEAAAAGADLVAFTELFLSGYSPEDLVLKPAYQQACRTVCEELARHTADGGPAMLIGLPWVEQGKLYNAYALLDGGIIEAVRFKVFLPNYGVFDEKRVFSAGPLPGPISFRGIRIGVPICEDIWMDEVVECLTETGAELFLVPNGSPYWHGKFDERLNVVAARVTESHLPMIYLNQLGGQDEVVFDGSSFILQADCALAGQLPAFKEHIAITRWEKQAEGWQCLEAPLFNLPETDQADYEACVLGLRDYVEKNRFSGVLLGLSGGIDSALCAAMAVDAIGAERVRCVMLPYHYTSPDSLMDAEKCAALLSVRYDIVPIASGVEGVEQALTPIFSGLTADVTEENIQSRIRGVILMALSNKLGSMLITTGNKSEMAVGYATLYGDMNGGFNPIKDLYKTQVYRLSALRNVWKPTEALGPEGEVIPSNILTKAPTAELRENQTDQDSLPPYDVLDDILHCLVEDEMSVKDIIARGHDGEIVQKIERLLYLAEYKRRQSAPGVKLTAKNFGRDRRYPITNRFRDLAR